MTDVFATGADAAYGYHAINVIGSVLRNSNVFDRIELFDLGLSEHQRALADAVPGVVRREVPPFAPHWAQCFTWKPWSWLQIDADRIFWLDAGATVLRSLDRALAQIGERGYFVVSQGNQLRDLVPSDYVQRFELPVELLERPYVAAGIIGFAPGEEFFRRVLVPTYEDCIAGLNRGFSPHEVDGKNWGLNAMADPPLRDCMHFRWDQTLLNIHLAKELPDAVVADTDEYAGWRSPRDHPRQVIWSHRRPGRLAYLKRVPYRGRGALRARAFGAWVELRWWKKMHPRLLHPSTLAWKARQLARGVTTR